ncbi:hypothetical protein D3C75_792960 [compost metagenome]
MNAIASLGAGRERFQIEAPGRHSKGTPEKIGVGSVFAPLTQLSHKSLEATMQQPKFIIAGWDDKSHTIIDQSSNHQAVAIIGAELIAYRVNRKPEQRARLLGLVQMADILGALNATDRAAFAANLERVGGGQ